jgi:hypothetical protein
MIDAVQNAPLAVTTETHSGDSSAVAIYTDAANLPLVEILAPVRERPFYMAWLPPSTAWKKVNASPLDAGAFPV